MSNRLAESASSYLRQHAENPVDWWPWEPAAFAEAARRDVPVLLSVGYASCHWCHVMAHESFEDPAVAALINEHFVPIKVDREERPDVDAVYMTATQALTGQGGWPMTCFLLPDGRPFYAGTYFPPQARHGLPGFSELLTAVVETWRRDRPGVDGAGERITATLRDLSAPALTGASQVGAAELDRAARALVAAMDPSTGGFAGAPKFPPAMAVEFLLRHHERTGATWAVDAVTSTLHGMARGGIHDQILGGFARYSVDSRWHVPHFEKMLDDNALLLRVFSHHARRTGDPLSRATAEQIATFLRRDLATEHGVFAASLDADTDGVEGATYTWSPEQLLDALGPADAALAAELLLLDVDVPDDLPGAVPRLAAGTENHPDWPRLREILAHARTQRSQPARDEMVVLRGNGMAIAALAEAGAALDQPEWVAAAVRAADHLIAVHRVGGRWRRSSRDGQVGPGAAVLADHAALAEGLLALYQATGDPDRLALAEEVLDDALVHFADPDGRPGRFADTAADAPALIVRPSDPTDGAAPSGASSLAAAALTAAALTGRDDLAAAATAILSATAELLTRAPRSTAWYLATAEAAAAGPVQIAVVGAPGAALDALARVARTTAWGGSVIEVGEPDASGRPLLAGRALLGGKPTAYVCRGFVCRVPVTTPAALLTQLTTDL